MKQAERGPTSTEIELEATSVVSRIASVCCVLERKQQSHGDVLGSSDFEQLHLIIGETLYRDTMVKARIVTTSLACHTLPTRCAAISSTWRNFLPAHYKAPRYAVHWYLLTLSNATLKSKISNLIKTNYQVIQLPNIVPGGYQIVRQNSEIFW